VWGRNFRRQRERLSDLLLTTLTILISVLLFVVAPLQVDGVVTGHYVGFTFGLVLIVAALTVSGSKVALGSLLIAIALVAISMMVEFGQYSVVDSLLDAVAWLISGLTLSAVVARAVFAPGRVTFHRVIGAVLLYLNIGLIFVALFAFVVLFVPDAFTGLGSPQGYFAIAGKLIYFSFVTLTTTGYGDIVPLHPYTRSLANIEAIIGQLYPATLLARLVTLELASRSDS
jgi:hypothetical protein